MHVEHHPLNKDFPELHAALHELRVNDAHFARLADEYEALDKRICRVEDGVEDWPTTPWRPSRWLASISRMKWRVVSIVLPSPAVAAAKGRAV
jgi:hypothetical protein